MTDNSVVPPQAGRSDRWLKPFLFGSLAVNLLVIGAVAGTALTWQKSAPRHGVSPRSEDYGLMAFTRDLPADRREPIRKSLRQQRAGLKPLWADIGSARKEAADVLATDPYDKVRLKDAIDKITAAEARLKLAGRDMFLGLAEQLEPSERRELSEWWRQKAERMGPGGSRHRKD